MRFALVGNPNSGKTTLFNNLTGSTAHTGNWPGVTVERKEGKYKKLEEPIDIIDLPGIYSLSPYTPEEKISRNYIINENPDLLVNIVDATNLDRNLYLTTQLLETDCPVIVALNMMDMVEKDGTKIDIAELEKKLGVPVVPISALRSDGIKELMKKAYAASKKKRTPFTVLEDSTIKAQYQETLELVKKKNIAHPVFHAVKLIEGDELEKEVLPDLVKLVDKIKDATTIDSNLDGDFEAYVANERYQYIDKHYSKVIKTATKKSGALTRSDKIDKVLTNKLLGIPIFLLLMFAVFHLTFGENLFFVTELPSPGVWLQGLTEELIGFISESIGTFLTNANAADWVMGLIVDGLIAGVGAVLSFLPQILLLFFFLSIMEDSGYMARVAFLMDRILRKFGLSGKAFMPLLMGFGCSVPAIMGTRTLKNENEKRLTIMLMPFFSCGAKLPIWSIFAVAFFPAHADLTVFAIYFLGIFVAVLTAIILKKTLFKGDVSPFIMELPAYHLPRLKNLLLNLWDKLKGFIFRAATIIAGATVVIWFLANFSFSFEMVDANSAESILGVVGNFIRPIFIPLGFADGPDGWKAVVAILTGLLAKEMVVSTMGVLYSPGIEGDAVEDSGAMQALIIALAAAFSPVAAVSFIAFNLLSVPCMAAVATAHGELRSKKWTGIALGFWLLTAWVVSFLIYNIGTLIFG